MFTTSGDGIKNYFTYAYHIKHDASYTNFMGMNYPYGENYLYTDCHPVIANVFKFLSSYFPFFETHSIGIINLLMILSIFFTFLIIYSLYIELMFNKWIGVFFSITITLLTPQIFRMGGHFALSYSVAIPLTWFFFLRYINRSKKVYLILLFVNNLFWMFIHTYLGIILLFFILAILLVKIISDKCRRTGFATYIWLGIVIISPIILFYVYAHLTDIHEGRTNNPSGFFLYNAEPDDILLPHEKPFAPILNKLSGGIIRLQWEAWGYVGLVNSILLVILLIIGIISIFRKKTRALLSGLFDNRVLNISLIGSGIVLLFAMGIPFKQFPKLLEFLPVLKQFRATGRFVWPFYFAFTFFAAYVFQKIILKQFASGRKYPGIVYVVLIVGITCWEGIYYHIPVSKSISTNSNVFKQDLLPENIQKVINHIEPGNYQAIISIPFYYQGSESYARPRNEDAARNSIVISYFTGLPNICANLTRTSIEESKRIVQIVSPDYYPKKIKLDMKDKRPILIIKTGDEITKYERDIIVKAKPLYKKDNIEVLEISLEDLFMDTSSKIVQAFYEKQPRLRVQNGFYIADSCSLLYYDSYENSKSDTSFRGKGSHSGFKKGKNSLATFPPNTFAKDKDYDISIWMYNGEKDALNLWFRFMIEEYDEAKNNWYTTTFFPEQAEVINGDWSLIEGTFRVNNPGNRTYIVTIGKENSKASFHADDLLIKDRDVDVYRIEEDSTLFYNNNSIPLY